MSMRPVMPHTGPCGGKRGSILDCLSPRLAARGESIVCWEAWLGVPPAHTPSIPRSPPRFL